MFYLIQSSYFNCQVSTSKKEINDSDINSLKPYLFHLTSLPNSEKGKSKVVDGIISVSIFLVDRILIV
jgi:hypothetical protein